jgi:hypothetical protein
MNESGNRARNSYSWSERTRSIAFAGIVAASPFFAKGVQAFDAPKGMPWAQVMDRAVDAVTRAKPEKFETEVLFGADAKSLGFAQGTNDSVTLSPDPFVPYFKSLKPGSEVCDLHTHVPEDGVTGEAGRYSMPPTPDDVEGVMVYQKGIGSPFEHLKISFVVVDPIGTWVFRPFIDDAGLERSILVPDFAQRVQRFMTAGISPDALVKRYVDSTKVKPRKDVAAIRNTEEYKDLIALYAHQGARMEYITHAAAKADPCAKKTLGSL